MLSITLNSKIQISGNKRKVKGWKKRNHANENHKIAAATMLISNKIDYKAKKILLVIKKNIS